MQDVYSRIDTKGEYKEYKGLAKHSSNLKWRQTIFGWVVYDKQIWESSKKSFSQHWSMK